MFGIIEHKCCQKLYSIRCSNFGEFDGMDGCCVECSINNKQQFEKCISYKHSHIKKKSVKFPPT